jgi:hypothetical protein
MVMKKFWFSDEPENKRCNLFWSYVNVKIGDEEYFRVQVNLKNGGVKCLSDHTEGIHTELRWESQKETDHLVDLDIGGSITLK